MTRSKKSSYGSRTFCWDISRFIHYWDFFAAQGVSQYTHSIKKIIASASDWKIHITFERIGLIFFLVK